MKATLAAELSSRVIFLHLKYNYLTVNHGQACQTVHVIGDAAAAILAQHLRALVLASAQACVHIARFSLVWVTRLWYSALHLHAYRTYIAVCVCSCGHNGGKSCITCNHGFKFKYTFTNIFVIIFVYSIYNKQTILAQQT